MGRARSSRSPVTVTVWAQGRLLLQTATCLALSGCRAAQVGSAGLAHAQDTSFPSSWSGDSGEHAMKLQLLRL